ncbi:hypothetical protein DFH07DRAFT_1065327 [Mycena maculata]|uniref:Uncharacterized protein n=1 Tax=Mycena maculata TaxID=230809 RepID=A0AAD7I318_9AGAR|nr:hypothetical protein DFH07DRAFT_1065327 [Mycena maculata]
MECPVDDTFIRALRCSDDGPPLVPGLRDLKLIEMGSQSSDSALEAMFGLDSGSLVCDLCRLHAPGKGIVGSWKRDWGIFELRGFLSANSPQLN